LQEQRLKVYISCVRDDLTFARHIYRILKVHGFYPWMIDEDVEPGENWKIASRNAITTADVFLSLSSIDNWGLGLLFDENNNYIEEESEIAIDFFYKKAKSFTIIPILRGSGIVHPKLRDFKDIRIIDTGSIPLLIDALQRISNKHKVKRGYEAQDLNLRRSKNFLISKVEIENIRCFDKVSINLWSRTKATRWAMILGDNAVGKSTLLRCIALGLCSEGDAIALMKAVSGDFLRKGAEVGFIKIHLREDKETKRPKKFTVTTRISLKPEDSSEIIRQETEPKIEFPWSDIFACGYGAYRAAQAHSSFEQYEVRDAVASLFDPQASLQNPEIVLLRNDQKVREQLEQKLLQILMLDEPGYKLNFTKRGLELDGPWGCLPFQVLSDGYRSTTQWVLDFIGWLIHAERLIDNPDIGGILLIDELEQHLHPRWQRYIVQRLRQQFPKTQIIASTHTPLTASGIVDEEDGLLLKLEQTTDGTIDFKVLDKQLLAGKRADQVLTSEAFGLLTTRNPGSEDEINRYTALLSKVERTEVEEAELQELKLRVQNTLRNGENAVEQMVATAVDETLQSMAQNISPEMLSVETRKQLQQLFQPEASE
jgi:predicted ATPase